MKDATTTQFEPAVFPDPTFRPVLFPDPPLKMEQYTAPTSAGYTVARPIGHSDETHHWENEFGVVTTYAHSNGYG